MIIIIMFSSSIFYYFLVIGTDVVINLLITSSGLISELVIFRSHWRLAKRKMNFSYFPIIFRHSLAVFLTCFPRFQCYVYRCDLVFRVLSVFHLCLVFTSHSSFLKSVMYLNSRKKIILSKLCVLL